MLTSFAEIDTIDHYHSALKQMLDTKAAGGTIEVKTAKSTAAPVVDIMSALQASLNAKQKAKPLPSEPSAQPLTLVPAKASKRKKTA